MKLKRKKSGSSGSWVLLLAIALMAVSVSAQAPYWPVTADPQMVVIPVRSISEIRIDLDNAMANKQLAIDRNTQAINRLEQIASSIDEREAAVDDINRRKDNAKNNKHGSEAGSLQIEEKANKKAIDLLQRLKDLREAEVEVAKVEEDHADIAIRVFQRERELQDKRSKYDWQSIGSTGNLTQNTAYQVLGEIEASLLKLQQELANSTKKVASRQKDVVDQRIKLHKAQIKLGM